MRSPLLMVPGPSPVDPRILRALGRETIHFVGREFARILVDTVADLKTVMQTRGDVIIMAGTGTLGLESAVANVVAPGDGLLVVNHGKWGERFATVGRCYGAEVTLLSAEWGDVVSPERIDAALSARRYRAVTVTHVETSTGVRAPVAEIAEVVRRHDCLFILDGVSSTGALPEPMDEWGVDVLVAAPQKALGCPPGLAMLGISPRAQAARRRREIIHDHYSDWLEYLRVLRDPTVQTHVTHPVNMICALREALRMVLEEGLETRIARHGRMARALRAALTALDFRILARDEVASPTVTVALYPSGVEDADFRAGLERHGVLVAPTAGSMAGKGIRIGHMGSVADAEILACIVAVERTLLDLGRLETPGKGVATAERALGTEC